MPAGADGTRFTPEEDAEDFGRLVRETRAMQDVSAAEPAHRCGVRTEDVLALEDDRVVPAEAPLSAHMQALGFSAV